MKDLISISSSALPETTRVVGFRGTERLSRPFEIEVFLSLHGEEGDELDLDYAVGAKARLTIDRADDNLPPFEFAGVFASVELLHSVEKRTLIRALLVPRLWMLKLSKHSRVFTKKAFPDVLKAILEDNGLTGDDFSLRLGSYEPEEHICQYRESDLDFVSRWLEREGIWYFFEHGEDGEKVVFCDDKTYEDDVLGKAIRYFPQAGHDRSAGASFRSFTSRHRVLPATMNLKDYDYIRPNLAIAGTADVLPSGVGEVSVYGDRFFTPAAGDRLAKLRAEELLAREVVFHAAGTRSHLRTGHIFELEEHPRGAFNTKYLAIEIRHHGNQAAGSTDFQRMLALEHEEVYFLELDAIAAKKQFRPETSTPWPRIYGFENAVVDGPAHSEYAQIDDQGRYNVKFKFDESNLKDAKASTFIRMMQPHGGAIEGFHFPLRKGTEVVLNFLGGDPDRPVIAGVVPNTLTPSPVTSANHTKNVIQTGGRNRFELEDKAGQQRITLSTPYSNTTLLMGAPDGGHELICRTDDDSLHDAGKNYDLKVGQKGAGTWTATIKDNWITHVQSGVHELWVDSQTSATTVKGDTMLHVLSGNYLVDVDAGLKEENVKGDHTTTVASGNYTVNVNTGNTKIETKGTTLIKSTGAITIDTAATCDVKVANAMTLKVGGDMTKTVNGSETLQTFGPFKKLYASNNVNVTGGFKSDTFLGLSNSNAIGASIGTFVGLKTTLECAGSFSAAFSVKIDIANGASLSYKMGVAATVNAAVEFTAKPVKARQYGTVVGIMGNKIINHLIKLETAATHIIT